MSLGANGKIPMHQHNLAPSWYELNLGEDGDECGARGESLRRKTLMDD